MIQNRPALFQGRHFEEVIIILCVRWNLRYSLCYRDLEETMAECGLSVDHVTIWRWVQRFAPILNQRLRRELRHPNRSWWVDETYVRVAGRWTYLYRAVDSAGATIDFMLSPKRDLTAASCSCAWHYPEPTGSDPESLMWMDMWPMLARLPS